MRGRVQESYFDDNPFELLSLQKRNLLLAFQAAESVGIKPSLVSNLLAREDLLHALFQRLCCHVANQSACTEHVHVVLGKAAPPSLESS